MILGALQGLTEFLPVSSSGHLVLGGYLLGLSESHLFFDVVVHLATLVATLVFFRSTVADIARDSIAAAWEVRRRRPLRDVFRERPNAWMLVLIVAGSVPTALIGLLFEEPLERIFGAPRLVAGILLVTAALLLVTRFVKPGERGPTKVGISLALIVGVAQGLAVIPGVSRSGSTIAVALLLGFDREFAARYSFLLSVPAICGALLLVLPDLGQNPIDPVVLAVGFLSAALVGIAALALLMPLVRKGRLHWFSVYLVPVAVVGLLYLP